MQKKLFLLFRPVLLLQVVFAYVQIILCARFDKLVSDQFPLILKRLANADHCVEFQTRYQFAVHPVKKRLSMLLRVYFLFLKMFRNLYLRFCMFYFQFPNCYTFYCYDFHKHG